MSSGSLSLHLADLEAAAFSNLPLELLVGESQQVELALDFVPIVDVPQQLSLVLAGGGSCLLGAVVPEEFVAEACRNEAVKAAAPRQVARQRAPLPGVARVEAKVCEREYLCMLILAHLLEDLRPVSADIHV